MSPAFPDGPCMHEALFDDAWLEGTGVTTLDFAKAMIDEGFHPMTMYFPLVVHGAMLIEPTETESKRELDRFCDALRLLADGGQGRRRRPLQGRALPRARCAAWTRPAPPARRCCAGPRPKARTGPPSQGLNPRAKHGKVNYACCSRRMLLLA